MQNNNSKKFTRIIIILSSFIAIMSIYILLTVDLADKPLAGKGQNFEEKSFIGGGYILTDFNGNKYNSDDDDGKLRLIYFGFTFCPDICPTSLHKLVEVINTLDKYQIDVVPIFITLDPKRDTPELLKEYLGHFHPKIRGLTGSEKQIKEVADLFKVYYSVAAKKPEDKTEDYMLDHTSFVYLMDKNGNYLKHFYMSDTKEQIIEYIRINKDKMAK